MSKKDIIGLMLLAVASAFSAAMAEEIRFCPTNITTIAPNGNQAQAVILLEITLPDSTNLDSLATITRAKLSGQFVYGLPDSLPMTLACAPALAGFNRDSLSLEAVKSHPDQFVDVAQISTTSIGVNSSGSSKFNITEAVKWMQGHSAEQAEFIIYPLEDHSRFEGIAGSPEVSVNYFRPERSEP